jgi:hypothetical protein
MGMDRGSFSKEEEVTAVSGAAFAIRRDLFEGLGGFDGSFFMYMEDTDLSWRARLAGYRCIHVADSIVYHDYTLRLGPMKVFYQERNRYMMLLKSLRWPTLLVLLPGLLLAEAVTWGFVLMQGWPHWRNKLRAYIWIVAHWSEVMEGRRRTKGLRKVRDRDLIAAFTHRLEYQQTGNRLAAGFAHTVFDPLFFALQWLALGVIWW